MNSNADKKPDDKKIQPDKKQSSTATIINTASVAPPVDSKVYREKLFAFQKKMDQLQSRKDLEKTVNVKDVPNQPDNIFITIGAGAKIQQIFINPFQEVLNSNVPSLSLIIDPVGSPPANTFRDFVATPDDIKKSVELFSKTDIKIFDLPLPLFPITSTLEDISLWCPDPAMADKRYPWKTDAEAAVFHRQWEEYLTASLKAGKNIFLGYHIDDYPDGFLLESYNKLKALYPHQLFMLMAHEMDDAVVLLNTVTTDQLTRLRVNLQSGSNQAEVSPAFKQDLEIKTVFKFFGKNENFLRSKDITLANLIKWTDESINAKTKKVTPDTMPTQEQGNVSHTLLKKHL